jgi:hypothetical protein
MHQMRISTTQVSSGSVNDRPRPGRRVTSPNQDRLIQLRDLHDRFKTAQHMQGIIGRLCDVGFDLWACTQDDRLEAII